MLHQRSGRATFISYQSFPEFLLLKLPRDELNTIIDTMLSLEQSRGRFSAKKRQDRQAKCSIAQAKSHRWGRRNLTVIVAAGIPFA